MIWLRESDVARSPDGAVSMRLGGIAVYGRSTEELTEAINLGTSAICAAAQGHLLIARGPLRHISAQRFPALGEQRLFQALIGPCLTQGDVDTLMCTAHTGGQFWTVFHANSGRDIDQALEFVLRRVLDRGEIGISELRDKLFPNREKGTWYSAQNILCRAATLGIVVQRDKYTFHISQGLSDALNDSRVRFSAFRFGRLDFR